MTTEHIPEPDFDWLAFQYAAGELQGAELEAFEKLLATDERAGGALAQAVLLGQAVVQCEQATTVVVPRANSNDLAPLSARRSFGRQLIAVSTVACSLMFVGWLYLRSPQDATSNEASTVAALWINGADEDVATDPVLPDHELVELAEDEPIPGWLLAAVEQAEDEQIMND